MITINLLPSERKQTDSAWMLKAATVAVAVLLIGGALGATAVIYGYSFQQSMKLKGIEKELAKLDPVIQESNELEAKQKVLNEKKSIINELVTNRIEWAPKLKQLAQLVPDKVWVEGLELRRVETKIKPPPLKDPKTGKLKPQKPKTIVDEFVDIVAVTADLGDESVRTSEMMRAIQTSPFFSGFEDLRHKRGALEPWLGRRSSGSRAQEEFNPDVWRFKLTMKRSKPEDNKKRADDEQLLARAN